MAWLARNKQKMLQSMGKADKTVDDDYQELKGEFRRLKSVLDGAGAHMESYIKLLKDTSLRQASIGGDIASAFTNTAFAPIGEEYAESTAKQLEVQHAGVEILKESLDKLNEFRAQFAPFEHRFKYAKDKRTDYDSARKSLEHAASKKGEKGAKMKELEHSVEVSLNAYESYNNALKDDLKEFVFHIRGSCLREVYTALLNGQKIYASSIADACSHLLSTLPPDPDDWTKSGVDDVKIMKEVLSSGDILPPYPDQTAPPKPLKKSKSVEFRTASLPAEYDPKLLPDGVEGKLSANGRLYYIDHHNQTTSWICPRRLSMGQCSTASTKTIESDAGDDGKFSPGSLPSESGLDSCMRTSSSGAPEVLANGSSQESLVDDGGEKKPTTHPEDTDTVQFDPSGPVGGDDPPIVKGGTLETLVERLTYPKYPDPHYQHHFMLTYRSFTTPRELLDCLIARYNTAPPEAATTEEEMHEFKTSFQTPVRLRVVNVLRGWINDHFYDFVESGSELIGTLRSFLKNDMLVTMEMAAKQLMKYIDKQTSDDRNWERGLHSFGTMPDSLVADCCAEDVNFLEVPVEEFARQLCLMEWQLWKKIRPWEFLDQGWTKGTTDGEVCPSPNVHALIRHFNMISQWVGIMILSCETVDERAKFITHFIKIADRLRDMHNFNGVMEIVAGLELSPVHRMKVTWAAVSAKKVKLFEQLMDLMSRNNNFRNLRSTLATVDPPNLPYLGMYLTDLIFIEDGNKNFLPNGLVSFDKRRKVALVIAECQKYQQGEGFRFREVQGIQDYLRVERPYNEKDAYQLSLICEPRGMTPQPTSTVESMRAQFRTMKKKNKS